MAKGKNMLGKFRGKVGATVFRTEAGIGQIASEYNPNPKNPRTLAQTKQRSKMNLAGLISSMTPAGALFGLDTKRRFARSAFVSNIIKQAVVSGTGTTESPIKAEIAPANIVFSKGASGNFVYSDAQDMGTKVSIKFTPNQGGEELAAMMGIVMCYENGKLAEIDMNVDPVTEYGELTSVMVNMSKEYFGEGKGIDCFLVPIIKTEGVTSATFDTDVDWAANQYGVSVLMSAAQLGAYGASRYVGKALSD